MKKAFVLVIAMLMALSLVLTGCGAQAPDPADTSVTTDTSATTDTSVTTDTSATPEPPVKVTAFDGTAEEVLAEVVNKAIEIEADKEYGIGSIECTPLAVDEDSCTVILGLTEEEFADLVESAVESKPNGSWFTHSVVIIKAKEGTNVEELANTIVTKTKPNRFGCLKPQTILGLYAGDYIMLAVSTSENCEELVKAFTTLSAIEPSRIDRTNDWSGGGLGGLGGLMG